MDAQKKFEGKHSGWTGKVIPCHCEKGALPDDTGTARDLRKQIMQVSNLMYNLQTGNSL